MTSRWATTTVRKTEAALEPLRDANEALVMERYMKFVAPFLGVRSAPRRRALRTQWHDLARPTSDELGAACLLLMDKDEREYHYAVYDLIERYLAQTDEYFLSVYVESLLTTKPWWDTVDGLGSTAVSPLCWRYNASDIVREWSSSSSRWLQRAAIQHQRGWGEDTDVAFVLQLCDAHSNDREFFIAKAIGWALRDLARLDARSVERFLIDHSRLSSIAVREARRGLDRLGRT